MRLVEHTLGPDNNMEGFLCLPRIADEMVMLLLPIPVGSVWSVAALKDTRICVADDGTVEHYYGGPDKYVGMCTYSSLTRRQFSAAPRGTVELDRRTVVYGHVVSCVSTVPQRVDELTQDILRRHPWCVCMLTPTRSSTRLCTGIAVRTVIPIRCAKCSGTGIGVDGPFGLCPVCEGGGGAYWPGCDRLMQASYG